MEPSPFWPNHSCVYATGIIGAWSASGVPPAIAALALTSFCMEPASASK